MTIAEQALAGAIRRRMARAIVIKDADAWEALHGQLQAALTNAWSEAMREGIIASLDRLRDLGPGSFTPDDGAAILRVLEASVGPEAIRAAMREPVINMTDALVRLGAEEVGAATGVAIAFQRPDLDALDALKRGNLFWIGESWNTHTRKTLDKILTGYFEEGWGRAELAARIAEDFATVTSRSEVYWDMLADHIATKGREIGRVTGYERAGIQRVQVRAHLDERTTPVCRDMHGRIIEVTKLRAQVEAYIDASARGDKATVEQVWTMHGTKADLSNVRTDQLKGTGSPPYHYRCRTITVAYFGPAGETVIETPADHPDLILENIEERIRQREPLARAEVGAIIARARQAHWGSAAASYRRHFKKHHQLMGFSHQDQYNQSAIDLIRRGNRDVYLSIRQGTVDVVFAEPRENAKGREGFALSVVSLDDNILRTHLWKPKISSSNDEVPAVLQPSGRGVMKWLFG